MRSFSRLAASSLLAVSLMACESSENNVLTVSAEEYGEILFGDPSVSDASVNRVSCATCHATSADDQRILTGAPMAGVTTRASYWGGSEIDLLRSINHCRYYFMSANEPWQGDEEAAVAIFAYLSTLPGKTPSYPFELGVLADPGQGDASRGEVVYNRACASCHGLKSTGKLALVPHADILPEGTLAAHPSPTYDDEDRRLVFVQKTRSGGFQGYGGTMPPFSLDVLPDEDLAALLTYLGVP